MKKEKAINFTFTFTNTTGFVILIWSCICGFNQYGLLAGVSLMLGRKTKLFNN